MSLSCIKKNTILSTKQDEALWFFWKENMKLKEKWIQYIPDKKMNNTTCYECAKEWTKECTLWINPGSYEIILDVNYYVCTDFGIFFKLLPCVCLFNLYNLVKKKSTSLKTRLFKTTE